MKLARLLLITLFMMALLAACGGSQAGDPVVNVESYLQAKAEGDANTVGQLLCSDMESVLEREARTFESVSDVRLEGMACQRVGDSDVVSCSGKYVATYGAEDTEFPLGSYAVVSEDGEWKWCGEAAP